jgi:Tol biopolymer transport system component
MPLTKGSRLGPYEIYAPIGAGGMGQVYKAHDTRLGRDVAIKVSAERFSERFAREAHAAAALNHPNVCTLHDVGPNYLVMELVEGPTLAERIEQGPVPLEEALEIAGQIADALDAAHQKGIVHRDLKPANIKIKPDGAVKVLDFGLAKMGGTPAVLSEDSPTLTECATQAGVILGTAAYMAPEQAKGKPVDKRADIWAFGVVLYEMLTGQRIFAGETVIELLAAVMKEEPQWDRVPAKVRPLLRRCLEKDPKRRLRDIGDAMPLLETVQETAPAPPRRNRWLWPGAAALFLITSLALSWVHFREALPVAQPVRFTVALPEKTALGSFAISPDGRQLAFLARGVDGVARLWVRALNFPEPKPLLGADISFFAPFFWSPDSRSIAFTVEGKLKKIDVTGGPPQTICDVSRGVAGGSWNRDDVILFGSSTGLMRVSAAGGVASPITSLNPSRREVGHILPSFLPDGKHFLYLRVSSTPENSGVYAGSLETGPEQQSSRRLLATGVGPVYIPSANAAQGQLLFLRERTLIAQSFDNSRMELTAEPVVVAEQVGVNGPIGHFSASTNGVLIYHGSGGLDLRLTWFDRQGKTLGTVGEPGRYYVLALSPDGTKAGVGRFDPQSGNRDLWLIDLSQGNSARFTFDPATETNPVFSPDGSRVAFASDRGGVDGLYLKDASGAGSEEVLLKPSPGRTLTDWSRDGRFLIFASANPVNTWVLPLDGDRKPFPFARTSYVEVGARLSPDGHWIAYRSNESGRDEIYVKAFIPKPDAGSSAAAGKWMISRNGGAGMVHWRRDGKELYYLASDERVMAVEVSASPVFHAGLPTPLFTVPPEFLRVSFTPGAFADVTPDGKRFLFAMPVEQDTREEFTVILNWRPEFKK